jgi:hypothetical protein
MVHTNVLEIDAICNIVIDIVLRSEILIPIYYLQPFTIINSLIGGCWN